MLDATGEPKDAASEALAQALAARGHQVRRCVRPHQALRLNRLLQFDLIWMVWPLTGMGALEFLRRLRQGRFGVPVALACRQEPDEHLRAQLKAQGVIMLVCESSRLGLAAAAAEACLHAGTDRFPS